jgi:hypothetical protein
MSNVLAAGRPIGHCFPATRPFVLGFEEFGAAVAFFIAVACMFPLEFSINYLHLLLKPNMNNFGLGLSTATSGRHPPFVLRFYATAVIMLSLPQLTSLLGGVLSRKFKVIIVRR